MIGIPTRSNDAGDWSAPEYCRNVALTALLVSLLLALAGPFGTYGTGSFFGRLVFWGILVAAALPVAFGARYLSYRAVPEQAVIREILAICAFTTAYLPILLLWINLAAPGVVPEQVTVSQLALYLIATCAILSVLCHAVLHFFVPNTTLAPEMEVADHLHGPRLLRRLPEGFDGRILHLEADGHHVKVVTTEGLFNVRIRLCDAVEEMFGVSGFCTHRSHWVAAEAVTGWRHFKGRYLLRLTNGTEVPVSAKYQPDVEAAGYDFSRGMEKQNA